MVICLHVQHIMQWTPDNCKDKQRRSGQRRHNQPLTWQCTVTLVHSLGKRHVVCHLYTLC